MANDKFRVVMVFIVPQVIELIANNHSRDEVMAEKLFRLLVFNPTDFKIPTVIIIMNVF